MPYRGVVGWGRLFGRRWGGTLWAFISGGAECRQQAKEGRESRNVLRTHLAGELRKELAGETVTLTGWVSRRRDHGGVIFIDLRDRSGLCQVVFRESELAERAHDLRSEFCVKVTGVVEARPEGSENPNLPSGEIEVNVSELEAVSYTHLTLPTTPYV